MRDKVPFPGAGHILAWVTPDEAKKYYEKQHTHIKTKLESDRRRELWKNSTLYMTKSKDELEKLCKKLKIPITHAPNKHDLVKMISRKRGDEDPTAPPQYSGDLVSVPKSISAINNVSMAKLKEILQFHGFPITGNKDQLALRVYLLRQGETSAVLAREENQLKDLINIYKHLSFAQRKLKLCHHIYQKRTFSSKLKRCVVTPPPNISSENLHELFEQLVNCIDSQITKRKKEDSRSTISLVQRQAKENVHLNDKERLCHIGAKVKVWWTSEEIGDSGWKPGWYIAYVQSFDEKSDTITVQYPSEPNCTYNIDVSRFFFCCKIKLVNLM